MRQPVRRRQRHDGQHEEGIRGGETRAQAAPVDEEDEQEEEGETDRDPEAKPAAAALPARALRLPQ